jgi:hypothetical protein
MAYDVGNPGPDLEQSRKCDVVKLGNVILTPLDLLLNVACFRGQTANTNFSLWFDVNVDRTNDLLNLRQASMLTIIPP